ncbi:MAG: amidohydrolase, partial [Deltaproteobacteria bacterium]
EGVVLKLRLGGGVERMRMKGAPPQLKMAIGENPKRVYGEKKRMPSTRMGNFYLLRKAFTDAQEYLAKWERYEQKKREDPSALPPARDLKLETLADVLRGKFQVHIHCYRQDGIRHLIELADTFGFRIAAFHHALEAYKVAEEIAARDIGVATFTDWWGYKMEAWDGIPYNAALLAEKGVRVAIKSDSGAFVQQLFTEAAKAMRYGLSRETALRAITLNPASILGVAERIGSIDVGKDADLVIFDRDPFDIYTRVEMTIIDGEIAFVRKGGKR